MTLSEAVSQGVARVRWPGWVSVGAYLKLDLLASGRGPWGHLYDRGTQEGIGAPTPQDVLLIRDEGSDWEPYHGPVDQEDAL